MRTAVSEAELDRVIRDLITLLGIRGYHTHDSRRSPAGFPDWVLVGRRGILFRELKGDTTRISRAQLDWGNALTRAGANWDVWRPHDLFTGKIRQQLELIR